jgi:hypothetical protein
MTTARDLARLAGLAQLTLDHRLASLREAAQSLDQSRMQLRSINAGAAPADLPMVAAERVGLTYQRWADVRRSELNLVIARQTADWIEARSAAGTAFGRLQALDGLRKRLDARR